MMTRRELLPLLAAPALAQSARPNLVFILVDDLRFDALGCTGHPFAKTPQIDRLAAEGAKFTNAFVTTPLCSPSRSSFLTGRYVHSTGVVDNTDHAKLSHELVTFPRLLRESGYETGYVGKWHMGMDDSPRPGFDRWVSFRGQGVYNDPPLNIDGKQVKAKGYMTDLLGEHAAEFVRRPRSKPFCLYVAHKAIHGPFTPDERHKDWFANETIRRTANAKDQLERKPAMTRPVDGAPAVKPGGGSGDDLIKNQLRCMASVDDSVGVIRKALEAAGQLDNTLIIFTSDNGYFWGEHGLGDKRWAYEESIRIPMIARYPKLIKPGTVIRQDALNIDIAPTMLDMAGLAAHPGMQGRSLKPLFGGRAPKWRQSFLAEYFREERNNRCPNWRAARTPEWKLIHYPDLQGMDELYDLRADPLEMNNVIADARAKGALGKMRRELAGLEASTGVTAAKPAK